MPTTLPLATDTKRLERKCSISAVTQEELSGLTGNHAKFKNTADRLVDTQGWQLDVDFRSVAFGTA